MDYSPMRASAQENQCQRALQKYFAHYPTKPAHHQKIHMIAPNQDPGTLLAGFGLTDPFATASPYLLRVGHLTAEVAVVARVSWSSSLLAQQPFVAP